MSISVVPLILYAVYYDATPPDTYSVQAPFGGVTQTSDDSDSQGGSSGNSFRNKGGEGSKQKGVCYNCGIEGHFASECRNPKENKAFVGGAWSDSEDDDEPQNDATYFMAIASQKAYDGGHVIFGSNLKGKVIGEGNITHESITITNVEHVSGLAFNLISVGDNSKQQNCLASVVDDSMLWHRRLGHANIRFDSKSYEGVFLGYSQTSKAYIVLNKETMRIKESLNVTFNESLPEPKSSPSVEDDRINEPIVHDLNGLSSLQANVSDEGYPKSL
ncbi:retrotransposon protein [Tanacetum coccineum]